MFIIKVLYPCLSFYALKHLICKETCLTGILSCTSVPIAASEGGINSEVDSALNEASIVGGYQLLAALLAEEIASGSNGDVSDSDDGDVDGDDSDVGDCDVLLLSCAKCGHCLSRRGMSVFLVADACNGISAPHP